MGMSAGGKGGGPKSEINVTPLVDVVLVLLIIFLVTMPVLLQRITIEIPRKMDSDEVSFKKTITILGKADGTIVLNDGTSVQTVKRVELAKMLTPMFEDALKDKKVFVDFEDVIPYSEAVGIMDVVKSVGAGSVAEQNGGFVDIALKIREKKQVL